MSPSSGCSNPAIMRSRVVLPQPDGPRSDRNSPLRTSRPMPSMAVAAPNRLVMAVRRTDPSERGVAEGMSFLPVSDDYSGSARGPPPDNPAEAGALAPDRRSVPAGHEVRDPGERRGRRPAAQLGAIGRAVGAVDALHREPAERL